MPANYLCTLSLHNNILDVLSATAVKFSIEWAHTLLVLLVIYIIVTIEIVNQPSPLLST